MNRHLSWHACAIFLAIVVQAGGDDRFITEDISFTAIYDGITQRYIRLLPCGFQPEVEHHLLIALHGHGSDRWQFADGKSPTGIAARNTADRRRIILVLPDYRAKTSWMGPAAEADVCQIIADVKKQFRIGKVILCGGSMGGSSALTFTAIHPELIDGVAAINGTANHLEYGNFQEAISESYGGTKQAIPEQYKLRSAEYWPERFTMPVGITASGKDSIVPPASVLRLASILEKMERPVLTIYREEMGHTSTPGDIEEVLNFVVDKALSIPASSASTQERRSK